MNRFCEYFLNNSGWRIGVLILTCLAGVPAVAAPQADTEKLANANTAFGFDLLKQAAGGQRGKNIFLSPYSVSSALQMVCNGAAGQTKLEMENVLHTAGLKPDALNAAYKDLDQSIRSETNAVLNIANSIWYRRGIELKPEFASVNRNFYGAKLDALDFGDPKSADIINAWADGSTHGRIKDVIRPPIDPATSVILANAIYFKGAWENKFEKSLTKARTFHLQVGTQKQTPMMEQHRKFYYQRGNGFQAVRLPYAGGHLGMYVFLPDTNSSLDKLIATLNGDEWQKIVRQFRDTEGTVMLPKFKMDYDVGLNKPLQSLGMRSAFNRTADFSAMSSKPLFVSEVKQKSFVEVNEAGTEAAAVTTVTMQRMAAVQQPKPFEMIVDHPFLFMICDTTGYAQSILFLGIIVEPVAGS